MDADELIENSLKGFTDYDILLAAVASGSLADVSETIITIKSELGNNSLRRFSLAICTAIRTRRLGFAEYMASQGIPVDGNVVEAALEESWTDCHLFLLHYWNINKPLRIDTTTLLGYKICLYI